MSPRYDFYPLTIRYEVRENVGYVTLNRPEKLSAINVPMRDELLDAFRDIKENDDIWSEYILPTSQGRACSNRWFRRRWGSLMKEAGPRSRPGLLIRRIFQPDPPRAAAALARLLVAQSSELAGESGDESRIDSPRQIRCEDGLPPRRVLRGQVSGQQRRHGRPPETIDGCVRGPRRGRTSARHA